MSAKRQLFAWYTYDFANTIYSALFITFFFPVLIKTYFGGSDAHFGYVISISTLLSALAVPVVGALSDQSGRRMPYLIVCTIGCCAGCFAIAFTGYQLTLALAVVSMFFYNISLAVYDSLLPKLAAPDRQGSVSGWGVAIGYLGTPCSLVAVVAWMSYAGWESELGLRGVFVLTSVLFLSIALYSFIVIREPRTASSRSKAEELNRAFSELYRTIRSLPSRPDFSAFLGCAFLFWNAIMSVVAFLVLFSVTQLGIEQKDFVVIYAGLAIAAAIGSWFAGKMTDRFGPKNVLYVCGAAWIVVLISFLFITTLVPFLIMGMLGGAAMATYQAAVRPFLIQFAGEDQMGEYFGFLALFNKASGAMGPAVFGWASTNYGYPTGIVILIAFFVMGMACLSYVPDKKTLVEREASS